MKTATIDESNIDLHQGGFIGGFYIRPMGPMKKGEANQGHAHHIDHCHNLVRGQLRIEWEAPDGTRGEVLALVPCKILIKAEFKHKMTALVDDTYGECWFAEAQAEKQLGTIDVPWNA
jgi:hypothetical protein